MLACEVLPREEPERGPESGALGFVPNLAVAGLPVDQRARGLSEPEELSTELFPSRAEVLFFDLGECGALRVVVRIQAARLVLIPAPRRALDPVDVEHAKIVGEPIELGADRTPALIRAHG